MTHRGPVMVTMIGDLLREWGRTLRHVAEGCPVTVAAEPMRVVAPAAAGGVQITAIPPAGPPGDTDDPGIPLADAAESRTQEGPPVTTRQEIDCESTDGPVCYVYGIVPAC